MRTIRIGSALIGILMLALLGLPGQIPTATAEDPAAASPCRALALKAVEAARTACGALGANSVCAGHTAVQAANGEKDLPVLNTAGNSTDLAGVSTLSTSAANVDSGAWGVAVLNMQPDASQPGLRAALFGEAGLASMVRADAANSPTLPVKVFDELLPVVLRAGAGGSFPQMGRFTGGMAAVADGRNAQNTWVRIRLEDTIGWASLRQVTLEGDISALPELDERDIAPWHLYTAPMQAFTLSSGKANTKCVEAGSGLLIQRKADSEEAQIALLVNGAEIRFASGTLVLRAVPGDSLAVTILEGKASVRAFAKTVEAEAGQIITARIGGPSGLAVIGAPKDAAPAPFAALEGSPLALLAEPVACMAGVMQGDKRVAVRSGPGEKEYTSLFYLNAAQIYRVEGWNKDAQGGAWWKLTNAQRAENWVQQAQVRTLGACDTAVVAQVEPGAGAGNDPSTAGLPPGGGGFAPAARTIWDAKVGTDQLVGECKVGALNYCAQMVAIWPRGAGLWWKGQEVKPYPLTRIRENVYVYNGRNGLGDANIKLVLSFDSPGALTMTQTLVLDTDPKCQHVNTFTASLK